MAKFGEVRPWQNPILVRKRIRLLESLVNLDAGIWWLQANRWLHVSFLCYPPELANSQMVGNPSLMGNKIRLCCAALVAMFAVPADAQSTGPVQAQRSPDNHQPSAMGGVKMGTPRPPVLDSKHRPITAGGFVKTGPVLFEDTLRGCHFLSRGSDRDLKCD